MTVFACAGVWSRSPSVSSTKRQQHCTKDTLQRIGDREEVMIKRPWGRTENKLHILNYQIVGVKTLLWLGIRIADGDQRLPHLYKMLNILELSQKTQQSFFTER